MYSFAKRHALSLVLLASCSLLSGCGDGLKEYAFADGRFTVRMPDRPKPVEEPDLPKKIKKVALFQQSGSYEVAWHDLPAEKANADHRLDLACDGAEAAAVKGKVLVRKSITLGGWPGRELMIEWPDDHRVVLDRMYLVKDRLYHVVASGPKWWVESPTSRRVIDSFALVEE